MSRLGLPWDVPKPQKDVSANGFSGCCSNKSAQALAKALLKPCRRRLGREDSCAFAGSLL